MSKCKFCTTDIPEDAIFCCYCGKKQNREPSKRRRSNGSGTVYQRGSSYTALHTIYRNGQRISRSKGGFATKKEAYAWLADSTALNVPTSHDKMTFAELYSQWDKVHRTQISAKKQLSYDAAYRTVKMLHNLYWTEITLQLMQEATDKAINTFNQRRTIKNMLHMMEDYSIKIGLPERHLTQYIVLPVNDPVVKKPFSKDEIEKLWNGWSSGDEFCGAILIMIHTGMRLGELMNMQPKNVHIEEGYMMGGEKTATSKLNEIIIIDKIKPLVQKILLPVNSFKYSDTIFRKKFDECLERNGISKHTTHECRHTYANMLNEASTTTITTQELMRHSNISQTQTYTHVTRNTKIEALERAFCQ